MSLVYTFIIAGSKILCLKIKEVSIVMSGEINESEPVKKIMKQAEITAKDIIEDLKGSIECGYMTYPELIGILRYRLKQAINEMRHYRPENMPTLSLEKIGLKKLYDALEELERKEQKK